jgi:transcriptional regulator with PAS, ATPase and Fis domain
MKAVVHQAKLYSKSEGTVLIYGESGTGKELFAQSIHNASRRSQGPFVSVNCASLNENLLESELFGYEEGAFTGALRGGRTGLFELAHGGTLFLDEIGEISINFQAKLLRALQEKEIRRIGGDRIVPIDVRIVCATNRSLFDLVGGGKFREDLYYRLAVLELQLLPLRDRREDIVPIALAFLDLEMEKENRILRWKSAEVFAPLMRYEWRGNARELQNFIQRLVICTPGSEITDEVVRSLFSNKTPGVETGETIQLTISGDFKKMESDIWRKLLEKYDGDKERLCKMYGISKTTLWRKLEFINE